MDFSITKPDRLTDRKIRKESELDYPCSADKLLKTKTGIKSINFCFEVVNFGGEFLIKGLDKRHKKPPIVLIEGEKENR
jgi:hypothetical protein